MSNESTPDRPAGATGAKPAEWLRGVVEPCLLALLADGEAYGYQLAARLETAGVGSVPGGTLYPALTRLAKQGLVSSQWQAGNRGPGRKYYQLTPQGWDALAQQAKQWEAFASAIGTVLRTGAAKAQT